MDEKELQAELRRILRDVGLVSSALNQAVTALNVLGDDVGYLAEKLGMVSQQAAPPAPPAPEQKAPGRK